MFTFILYIVLALIFGYFATQNTQLVSLRLLGATLSSIPLYAILGATLLVGLTFSWLISLFDTVASRLKIHGKENTIKDGKHTIEDLKKKITQLELDNAKLSGEVKGSNNRTL